jgi:MFS family permease
MYEPEFKVSKEYYFSFFDFIKRLKESNFAKFVIFVACLNFSVNLASPFFAVLMLRDLKFNYITYTIIILSATIVSLLTIDRWGIHADRIGNIKIIRLTSLSIGFIPILWIICRNPFYLIFAQIFSGFFWSGFNLCASNFILDAVSKEKRTRCISYFNVINGTALCLGALMGGYLATHLPSLFGYRILSLFLISGILRLVTVLFFSAKIKEVRKVEEIKSRDLFYSMIGIKPIFGVSRESLPVLRREDQ